MVFKESSFTKVNLSGKLKLFADFLTFATFDCSTQNKSAFVTLGKM